MRLNNKGYMLVEIIIASVVAMTIVYYMTDLTIKLKNRNDDLLVKTLVATDQAIIYNTIMKDLYSGRYADGVSCNGIRNNINITTNDNNEKVFTYRNFTNIVSKYAVLGDFSCDDTTDSNFIQITIPLSVNQLPNEDFDVKIRYKK